jgi:hypothetical protein
MPITYDHDGSLLRITVKGVVTGPELHELVTELDQRFRNEPRWPNNLLDLSTVELSGIGFLDMMSLAKRRETVTPPNPIRTAIVATSPTVIGFARMFQNLNNNPQITVQLFNGVTAAEAWLAD